MMDLKKNLPLTLCLLALFLFTVVLAGCGTAPQDTSAPADKEAAAPSSEKSSDSEPVLKDLLGKGKALNEMSFDCETQVGEQKMLVKTWIKGKKVRSEMESPEAGGKIINIIDSAAGVVYVYQPEQKMATKMDISMAQQDGSSSPQEDLEAMNPEKMKYVGKDTIDGKKCLVYEITEDNVGTSKVWLWEENGIPLRMEVISDGEKIVMEYRNIKIGGIPDSMFELPKGTQIMEFNMPTMPTP
jgi:outer membrane lipoprotein-sorting protein